MSMANVVTLPRTRTQQVTKTAHRRNKAARRQATMATVAGLVAATLTALSLTHLAHGIALMTGCPEWESWAMAIGIDLGFISLELLSVNAVSEAVRRKISRHAHPAIIGTLAGSAILNAIGFASRAVGNYVYPAAILGAVIPALIYFVARAATTAYLSRV